MEAGFPWTGGKPLNENEGCTERTGTGMAILRYARDIILLRTLGFIGSVVIKLCGWEIPYSLHAENRSTKGATALTITLIEQANHAFKSTNTLF